MENNVYCVYRHIRLDTLTPFYIGIGKGLKRPYFAFGRNDTWNEIVKSAGYRVDIILEGMPKKEALLKEREFIALYGRTDLNTGILCNRNAGGQSGTSRVWTDAQRAHQSKISKTMFVPKSSRIAAAQKMKGRSVPKERIAKMLATRAISGWSVKESTKKKISESKKGKKLSVESSIIMSETRTKSFTHNYKTRSPRNNGFFIEKSDLITGEILKIYKDCTEASLDTRINLKNIWQCVSGRSKSSGGFGWKLIKNK